MYYINMLVLHIHKSKNYLAILDENQTETQNNTTNTFRGLEMPS